MPYLLDVISDCDHNSKELRVTVLFNTPFHGFIYADGFFGVPQCTWKFSDISEVFLQIPFVACGTISRKQVNVAFLFC